MPSAPEPQKALTEHEAAGRLALSVKTLRDWRLRGVGPRFARFGRAVRYMSDDVDSFIRLSIVLPKGAVTER